MNHDGPLPVGHWPILNPNPYPTCLCLNGDVQLGHIDCEEIGATIAINGHRYPLTQEGIERLNSEQGMSVTLTPPPTRHPSEGER